VCVRVCACVCVCVCVCLCVCECVYRSKCTEHMPTILFHACSKRSTQE
jgi:hypothetical protein